MPFKRWLARIRCCRLRQDEPTLWLCILSSRHTHYRRPSILRLARSWARPRARHTPAEFIAFFTDLVANQPRGQIHVIADNLSAHRSQAVPALVDMH